MRPPLEIRTSRGYWKRIVWLAIGVAPFVALAVAQSVKDWDRRNDNMPMYILGVAAFLALTPVFLLLARRRWVQRIDDTGVTLRNGRRFLWSAFVRCEPRWHRRLRIINNYDLVFRDGTAGVYHLMAANADEVMEVVRALERGDNPFVS